ncbi:RNA polymerase sigma factor [Sphingobacterium yanglingense]|uniref:RNA polymerase sigma factor n=1 Tax=Sphingobacterium yanglingense TaxID=1437280 RepID=A0A4R6WHJ5_9SPHI|nr:RNA polymerase sigma-70 factor [Sphingobacterium yanglingense]TDQ77811.1 RNA polymerase sigma-70 factor (ECF subfamily) [Sphingobacterium yanglingense]
MKSAGQVDKKVLIELRKGDYLSFKKIYHAYAQRLYSFIFKVVKDVDLADDVLQLTFVRIWNNREQIDEEKLFDAYIFQIASNLCIDTLRQIAQQERKKQHLYQQMNELALSVEEQFLIKEKAVLIDQLLDSLPPQRRLIFTRCKLEGYSYQEVADELGISTSTVSNQLVMGVKTLREEFNKHKDAIILTLLIPNIYIFF